MSRWVGESMGQRVSVPVVGVSVVGVSVDQYFGVSVYRGIGELVHRYFDV